MPTADQTLTLRCQFCQTWNRVDGTRAAHRPKCGQCARFLLLDRPWTLHADSFERTVRESTVPVLVDFYADWCGPCKMMAPLIDQLAARVTGTALVAKLDTDRAQAIAGSLGIRGIPTIIVFREGREVARQSGVLPLPALEQLLQQARQVVGP